MKNTVRLMIFSMLATVLPLAVAPAWGQTGVGVIRGTVRDARGQVVPGAEVTITDTETNLSRTAVSSNVGIYYFGAVSRGPDTVLVKKQGFKSWSGTLLLDAGQMVDLDVGLEVGSVQTAVEVRGAAALITTAARK